MTQLATRRTPRPGRWYGPARMFWLSRQVRRSGDFPSMLRSVVRGEPNAVGVRLRGRHLLLVVDPALAGELLIEHAGATNKGPGMERTRHLLGDGLLTSEGADHRRARRLVAPAFSPRRLTGYVDQFAERTAAHVDGWADGATVDMHQEMATLTLDMVGRTLLGIDLRERAPGIRSALEATLAHFAATRPAFNRRRARSTAATPEEVGVDTEALAAVHELVDDIVEQRRANPSEDRGDVISALLAAAQEPDGLRPAEVHDHVLTLLMAGHETTANALSWTMHLLGENPDAAAALHDEVDALGRPPTSDDLPSLTYTRAVVSEAIRMYPPAWMIGRSTDAPIELGGWQVPAGSLVAVCPLLMQHDARWFPEPDTFDPSRWLDERRERVPKYAYLPFGTGPRSCVGEQFAWAEAITALAVIARRFTARTQPGHVVKPQYRITMRPGNGIPMRLTERG
ncbi:MAG TPA: cytochrome P450 [Pseudonocardiaceae bacterium]|nr:cytochrome P450 [Pseudonocardiaceae bacterium]